MILSRHHSLGIFSAAGHHLKISYSKYFLNKIILGLRSAIWDLSMWFIYVWERFNPKAPHNINHKQRLLNTNYRPFTFLIT